MDLENPSFIGKRQQHLNCVLETKLNFSATNENEKAGIIVFQNESHFYYLCKTKEKDRAVIQLCKSVPDSKTMEVIAQATLPATQAEMWFRIRAKGEFYDFEYALKANDWKSLKDNVDAKFLSTHVAGGFIGCIFGMYATASGSESSNSSSFKYLAYEGNDPMYK